MTIDWVELSNGDYENVREAVWPRIEPHLPESGSILDGGIDNVLAEAFSGAWRLPGGFSSVGDYNQIKIYRSALQGEIRRELDERRLATYRRVYDIFQDFEDPPKGIQSGHIIALLDGMGIALNQSHRKELLHYVNFRRR